MSKTVTIHQPSYWPYLGIFAKISKADTFVFLDNVQYEKNEFKNRNKIFITSPRVPPDVGWLTLPVRYQYPQQINEVFLSDPTHWIPKNLKTIQMAYGSLDGFHKFSSDLISLYQGAVDHVTLLKTYTLTNLPASCFLTANLCGLIQTKPPTLIPLTESPIEITF